MKEKWGMLLKVLNQILSIYRTLLTLSQQKKQILVAAKSHDLEKVTKQEETLILQASKLEDLRGKLVDELMAVYGIAEDHMSLAELQEIAAPDVGQELAVFSQEFGAIMAEMVPLNKLNSELIQQALSFINYNVNILSQTVVGPTYAAKGQANEQSAKRRVFDARV